MGNVKTDDQLGRISAGLFGLLLGAVAMWQLPAGHYVFPLAVTLVVGSVYVLVSAFVPALRWPRDR